METHRGDNVPEFEENYDNGASQPEVELELQNIQNRKLKEAWSEKDIFTVSAKGKSSSQRKSDRKKAWLTSLRVFAAEVSVVGLRYVANTSVSTFRRSIWILLILIGGGFTIFQIQNRIRYYAAYPVNVIIRVQHEEEMRFPTVTICNENMVSLSRLAAVCKWRLYDFCKHFIIHQCVCEMCRPIFIVCVFGNCAYICTSALVENKRVYISSLYTVDLIIFFVYILLA